MIRPALGAAMLLLACGCAGTNAPRAPETFKVVEENAAIDSVLSVASVRRHDADTVLIRTSTNRWYKADVKPACAKTAIGSPGGGYPLETTPDGRVDQFTRIVFDSLHRCQIQKLDRIETPQNPHG